MKRVIDLRPPARSGDLAGLDQIEGRVVVLIDGLFGRDLAVSPQECRQSMEKGAVLLGASSIGALRAADLWSLGMIGVGEIYTRYRLGILNSDADVAVAYSPEPHREVSVSYAFVQSLVFKLQRRGLIGHALAERALSAAKSIYWAERTWQTLLGSWLEFGLPAQTANLLLAMSRRRGANPKVSDARAAIALALNHDAIDPSP